MDIKEYMSVRRAYNIVRQVVPASERLTFEELSILCHLSLADEPQCTSAIAEYQGALRPTMTHRTNHLCELGLIVRSEGVRDRRNIICSLSSAGEDYMHHLCARTRMQISSGRSLSRTSPERICKYVDAMGSIFCQSSDLVLLSLSLTEGSQSITQLVDALGLLQPTVSMSVATLCQEGLAVRVREACAAHNAHVTLTDEGREAARGIREDIEALVVRRTRRAKVMAREA